VPGFRGMLRYSTESSPVCAYAATPPPPSSLPALRLLTFLFTPQQARKRHCFSISPSLLQRRRAARGRLYSPRRAMVALFLLPRRRRQQRRRREQLQERAGVYAARDRMPQGGRFAARRCTLRPPPLIRGRQVAGWLFFFFFSPPCASLRAVATPAFNAAPATPPVAHRQNGCCAPHQKNGNARRSPTGRADKHNGSVEGVPVCRKVDSVAGITKYGAGLNARP